MTVRARTSRLLCVPTINYSLLNSGRQVVITHVEIPRGTVGHASIPGFASAEWSLPAGVTHDVRLPIDARQLALLTDAVSAQVIVRLESGGELIADTRLLPLGAWDQRKEFADVTASFVVKEDPFVKHVVRRAAIGPDAVSGSPIADVLVKRLYRYLSESYKLVYWFERDLIPPHWEQVIRFPRQIHADSGGTCIDLVLLFASVCLRADLCPLILFFGDQTSTRHALFAVWRDGRHSRVPTPPWRMLVERPLLPVDATWLTRDRSFEDAVQEAHRWLREEQGSFLWAVDIAAALDGDHALRALPSDASALIRDDPEPKISDTYSATKSAEASDLLRRLTIRVVTNGTPDDTIRIPRHCFAVRIGRSAGNQVKLRHSSVSSAHAVAFVKDGALFIKDLGSTRGTRLAHHESPIEPYLPVSMDNAQHVWIGDVELELSFQ